MFRKSLIVVLALLMVASGFAFSETGYAKDTKGNHAMELELVREFDAALGEFPKGIAFDRDGNIYFGMQMLGQVRKLAPDGTETVVAQLPFFGADDALDMLTGVAVVEHGGRENTVVYATVAEITTAGDTGPNSGVYRILSDGSVSRVPGSVAGNGITVDRKKNLYISDSLTGSIWRVRHGADGAELWAQDPLLAGDGSLGFGVNLGAGGLAVDGRSLLVTVEEKSRVVRIDIKKDGSAGQMAVVLESHPALYMCEGIAVSRRGATYVSSWFNSTLSLVGDDGRLEIIADQEDGLLGPVTLAFGTGRLGKYLYVVNQSGFIFPDPKPALYRIKLNR